MLPRSRARRRAALALTLAPFLTCGRTAFGQAAAARAAAAVPALGIAAAAVSARPSAAPVPSLSALTAPSLSALAAAAPAPSARGTSGAVADASAAVAQAVAAAGDLARSPAAAASGLGDAVQAKLYAVIKDGRTIQSETPGRYAGWGPGKIFGRLDCWSGLRMKPENRVFFARWKDAARAGYRPCKFCKPTPGDHYPGHAHPALRTPP